MVEAGAFVGAFIPSEVHELYDSELNPPSALSNLAPQGGLRLGYFPWPFVGLEGEGHASPIGVQDRGSALVYALRSQLVLQLPIRLTPFVAGGGGLLGITGDGGDDVDRVAHWGAGLKYYFDSRWSVRLDGRHLVSAREGPQAGNTHHFEASLGVSFALYRAPERRLPPPAKEEPEPPAPPMVKAQTPSPPVEATPTVVERESVRIIEDALRDVRFDFDSAELRPSQRPLLDRIVGQLRDNERISIEIRGYACDRGKESYNQQLSERRARAVRNYLVAQGLSPTRIRVRGLGERDPKVPNVSEENRSRNRRTEFDVMVEGVPQQTRRSPDVPGDVPRRGQ